MKYNAKKTAWKTAPPFFIILICNSAKAALSAGGITIDDQTLYTIALAGYGTLCGIINYFKNRKKNI